MYVVFDETGAQAAGVAVDRYNRLLAALLVVPVAAATRVRGFKRSVAAAACVGRAATLTGVTLSYRYDLAAGGTIVLVAIAVYAAVAIGVRVQPSTR